MVWCSYCAKDQHAEADDVNGFTCCTGCGRVLDDNIYSSDPTFLKGSDGQSQLQGNFVKDRHYRDIGAEGRVYATDSHERTLEKGRNEITDIAEYLSISGREDAVNAAHRLYVIAVERNFTRGRRTIQVAAACLYIICRQEQKPFLLIDFSDFLQTSVYVLGAVFLQLCQLLSLEQHPIMQKPVDPSLFIHRFTDRLLRKASGQEKKFHPIANMALRLVASMKRDWMQTGRRPSGICGAALFISAHIHGFECTKTDVVSVVHICEGTLTKRLIEFENTDSGSLTAEEFEARAKDHEFHAQVIEAPKITYKGDDEHEVLCEHKVSGAVHFAVGLCKGCYEEFVRVSGGLDGGAAPPAFQVAERKRRENEKNMLPEEQIAGSNSTHKNNVSEAKQKRGRGRPKGRKATQRNSTEDVTFLEITPAKNIEVNKKYDGNPMNSDEAKLQKVSDKTESCSNGQAMSEAVEVPELGNHLHEPYDSGELKSVLNGKDKVTFDFTQAVNSEEHGEDEEETFSDIDDDEVQAYLHDAEEIRLKTIIWTEMNKEYLEEQQAKEDAIAASQAAHAAILAAAGADSIELAAAAAAAVAELKKDRKRKRDEAKSKGPAETATEATRQMLANKGLSSKINYNALESLFDGEKVSKVDEEAKVGNIGDDNKHVTWADRDVIIDPSSNEHIKATKDELADEEKDLEKQELEEDEDYEREDDPISNYALPYGDDYEYDGYDEY